MVFSGVYFFNEGKVSYGYLDYIEIHVRDESQLDEVCYRISY